MNFDEFKSVIGECIQNPDLLTEKAESLLDAVKLSFDTTEAQAQEIDALKTKNNELRDTNAKYVLRLTEAIIPQENNDKPEQTPQEVLDSILAKIQG